MSVEVITFVNGKWNQNCYFVVDGNGDALIVDPGSQARDIMALVERGGWRIHGIINTHGHYDHMGAVADLMDRFQVPFYLHGSDDQLLRRANLYRMLFDSREPVRVPKTTQNIASLSRTFAAGPFAVSWMGTPGHTEGSVCLQIDNYLFSGDTLMRGALGRTDLPGGNRHQLLASVRKLMDLPGDTVVCGGHGPRTTLAAEFSVGAPVWRLLE